MPQRPIRLPRRWLLWPLALATCLALPQRAAAQDNCVDDPCGPGDFLPPTITISPTTSTQPAGTLQVQIDWTDNVMLDSSSHSISFNGNAVSFTYTKLNGTNWKARSTGSVTIGTGTNTLTASICDNSGNCNEGYTVTYTGPPPSVSVTPDNGSFSAPAGSRQVARFAVRNPGTAQTTYNVTALCAGATGCGVSAATGTVTVAPGDSAYVDVSFTAPSAGQGTVRLAATLGTVADTGLVSVGALAVADAGYPFDARSLERIERGDCVIVGLGAGAANECGDLRVVHPLPGARSMNKERAPVLYFNSIHARPYVMAAAHVAPRPGTRPDTIRAYLTVAGNPGAVRKWPGWPSDTVKRVVAGYEAWQLPTGIHAYRLDVVAEWNGSAVRDTLHRRTGRLVQVNHNGSAFGAGWWLAGLERLHVQSPADSVMLWVGGDGSARIYRAAGAGVWKADAFDRPDSLTYDGAEYTRWLSGGARVVFGASGHHLRTENSLGHVTHFRYNENNGTRTTLREMVLPTATGQADSLRYAFEYGTAVAGCSTTTAGLSRVGSPAPGGGYRWTSLCADAQRRVHRITDPNGRSVAYGYESTWLVNSRTDRRGGLSQFIYGDRKFGKFRRVAAPGDTLTTTFNPGAALGFTTATPVGYVYLSVRDPRGNSTWFHLAGWGLPKRIDNALGQMTTLERGDPRWPARVTRVVRPNGFETTTRYDTHGNPSATTSWNPYGDGRNATTMYEWDPRWDAVTRVTSPEGQVASTGYDTQGRRTWEQLGTEASRVAQYTYYPQGSTAPGASGLVSSVTQGGLTEQFEYDARGNLSAVVSPTGIRAESVHDRIGRTTLTREPSGDGGWKTNTVYYDAVDQVDSTVTAAGTQRLTVRTTYDEEGNVKSVSRRSTPDPAQIDWVTTQWVYDLLGRRTVEIAPDGLRDSTVYDRAGNVVEAHGRRRDGAGNRYVVRMKYDVLNRLAERVVPQVVYLPEDVGIAQRSFIYPHENVFLQSHYPLEPGRQKSPPYPFYPTDPSTWRYVIPTDTSVFAYHVTGGMTQADNRDARVRRGYYPNGQLQVDSSIVRTVAEVADGGSWTRHVYAARHAYDRAGRRVELLHPDSIAPRVNGVVMNRTQWAYDRQTGALSQVTDPLGNTFRYHYNPLGQVDSLTLPGGITDTYRYDQEGNLVRQLTRNGSQSAHRYPSQELRYDSMTYDVRGKLLRSTNRVATGDTTIATYTPFGHLDEVTTISRGDAFWGVVPTSRVTENSDHDALGNRTGTSVTSTFELGKSYQENPGFQTWAFQPGTGRQFRMGSNAQRDTTIFDEAGNVHFSTTVAYALNSPEPDLRDQMYYYGADNLLRATDTRIVDEPSGPLDEMSPYARAFEVYRYDALGRRVLVWMRRDCYEPGNGGTAAPRSTLCETPYVRRTVWDGDRELYEIQAWAGMDGAWLEPAEKDTGYVGLSQSQGTPRTVSDGGTYDINPFYGRVAYTHGLLLDQPLAVVRMGYGDLRDTLGNWHPARRVEPFVIVPVWNFRGQPTLGTYRDGGWRLCAGNRCVANTWTELSAGYVRARIQRNAWHGSLLEDKADASGLNYRRNRYYDPGTGRFTQEDPIGLEGGLNVYGFAEGDPVSYGDPSGLCAFGIGIDAAMGRCGDALGAGMEPRDRDIIINQLAEITRLSVAQVRAQLRSRNGLRLSPGARLPLSRGTSLVAREGNVLRLAADEVTATGENFDFVAGGYTGVIRRMTMNFHEPGVPTDLNLEGNVRVRGLRPAFTGRLVFGAGISENPTQCRFRASILPVINRCN